MQISQEKLQQLKKYKWHISVGAAFLLIIGIWQYSAWQARLEEERIAKQKDFDEHQVVVEIALKASEIYYEEYVDLKAEDPDYYQVLADSENVYDAINQWKAIDSSRRQAVVFLQEDISDLSSSCTVNTLCNGSKLPDFFSSMERALSVHIEGLDAWANSKSYEGNELIQQADELLDKAGESFLDFQNEYSAYITTDQYTTFSEFSSSAFTETTDNITAIYSYCSSIDPQFHDFARYKNICGAASESSSITLNPYNSSYFEVPIKFTGRVSTNTEKIVVTADSTGDVYTLTSFKPGDSTFYYQASTEASWNNLVTGYNTYYFVAHFTDGTTDTETATIYYYPLYTGY